MTYIDKSQTDTGWCVRKVSESGRTLKRRCFTNIKSANKYVTKLKKEIKRIKKN